METTESPKSSGLPRREFIKKTATAAAVVASTSLLKAPVYGQNQAPSANVTGANNRIAVAVVGLGVGIGQNHFNGIHEKANENNTVMAAACDLYSERRDLAKKAGLKDADIHLDYRKIVERKDIDGVVVATHDPWHAQIAIDCMESGKHVYCEKPLSRYLDEAFQIHDTVKKTKKVFQIGSQGCSAGGYKKCADLVKAGKIGELVWAQAWYSRNSIAGEWNYPLDHDATAQTVDWERWLGKVNKRTPFSQEHFHRWRKYYQYCAGPLGDLAPHRVHPLMLATGNPQFPVRVVSIGTKPIHIDKAVEGTPERDIPEHAQVLAEFPSGFVMMITCCTVNGSTPGLSLFGHKANLNIDAAGGVAVANLDQQALMTGISATISGRGSAAIENSGSANFKDINVSGFHPDGRGAAFAHASGRRHHRTGGGRPDRAGLSPVRAAARGPHPVAGVIGQSATAGQ